MDISTVYIDCHKTDNLATTMHKVATTLCDKVACTMHACTTQSCYKVVTTLELLYG